MSIFEDFMIDKAVTDAQERLKLKDANRELARSHAVLLAIVERWLIACDLAGVDAERDGAIPDNPSLNPYVQLLRDSRAALAAARGEL